MTIEEQHWKSAAAQEGVDYDAVAKSFMDQAYGVVGNKAKVLFQDPFRLGFEIVNRNEKATKMVGIFAFRISRELLYAPVFFVNGEIKAADMLYRADVKRFVPLTEDWCAYLIRGVKSADGKSVERNRRRQPDAHLDRLAYPQHTKYASVELENEAVLAEIKKQAADGTIWRELMTHCADQATNPGLIIPSVISENGPEMIEKLAGFTELGINTQRCVAENYSLEELTTAPAWMAKEAAAPTAAETISLVREVGQCKSAAEITKLAEHGYCLEDSRDTDKLNVVVEEASSGYVGEVNSVGPVSILLADGESCSAILLRREHSLLDSSSCYPTEGLGESPREPDYIYFQDTKELLERPYRKPIFGELSVCDKPDDIPGCCCGSKLSKGKYYVAIDPATWGVSRPFRVEDIGKDGECISFEVSHHYGGKDTYLYSPNRESEGKYISDDLLYAEVAVTTDKHGGFDLQCKKDLMSSSQLDAWIRTAGGSSASNEVTVKPNSDRGTFDVIHKSAGVLVKVARDLGMLEAHLTLAGDFNITCDKAGEILHKASDRDVTYNIYDSMKKSGYATRMEPEREWIRAHDSKLGVDVESPQQQVLATHTPERPEQEAHWGDTFQRIPVDMQDGVVDALPDDAVFNSSPEELAEMSQKYDMPHIFDHGALEQLSTPSLNITDQIRKYIPDMEAGVDKNFRVLFLLRYRPAEFEEEYGKDALLEMEQDLADLSAQAGNQLLRLLKRFDTNQYK